MKTIKNVLIGIITVVTFPIWLPILAIITIMLIFEMIGENVIKLMNNES